ncbi:MAG: Unknown protein [uncultured Sulfurovum sp.]|uniref:HNH nuclease domain-containing protein n=1 Tax=uncultured Sulfurovum sp. TaxID=269237 RepID=A0A6S6SFK2_9BACT|nr:MAG: Unknown protein [uncultured Sulfurovum sp.]
MIKLDYKKYLKSEVSNFERRYIRKIILNKFEKPKSNSTNKTLQQLEKEKQFDNRKKISILRVYSYLLKKNDKFKEISLEDIILAKPENLTDLLNKIKTIDKNHELYTTLTDIFKYTDKFQDKVITKFFTNNFNFTTCLYCNKDFIINFNAPKKTSTFQLDHFYDKGKYPYLALSFYNLIPSCSTCNSSKVKGSKDCFKHDSKVGEFENETCKIPNHEKFDFDQKVKFKLFMTESCKDLNIKNKENIDIKLKENYSNEYEKYIEVFKLNERYQAHKDIVFEMIKNAELYPESRLKELQELTGIPYQEIKKDIFNLIEDDADLSKEPFSKLKRDMAKELGLT